MAQPLCPYFGKCGGCSCQHIDYNLQLENKKDVLEHFTKCNAKVFHDKEYYYRNRMDFIFHYNGLGLRKKEGKVIDVERCVIANEKINILLGKLRKFFKDIDYFDFSKAKGTFKYVIIRATSNDSSISFVLDNKSASLTEAVEKIREFANKIEANNILVMYAYQEQKVFKSEDYFVVKGKGMLKESYLGMDFLFPSQAFFQNNSAMAEKMHQYCSELLGSYNTKDNHLVDLYAGAGCFGIINARLFRHVTLIESVPESIEAAKINIKNNNIKNAEAILLDASKLRKLNLPENSFVITDPPRSGMDEKTIRQLKELKPKVIIYISCNVMQLKKDIKKFKGYQIKSAALFDFFPQTNYIESVVELVRR